MLPFIMISNCIYLLTFAQLRTEHQTQEFSWPFLWAGPDQSELFIFISKLLMENLLAAPLASRLLVMMYLAPLWTAVLRSDCFID
jgi:hypothetical protein